MKVAVIGGGPAGLVTLKHLLEAHKFFDIDPIEAVIFEAEAEIGGTFRYRSYERAELVSSRYLTAFSDFRLPADQPDFLSITRYLVYLEDYCHNFNLWPHIKLSTRVSRVRQDEKGGHKVYFNQGSSDVESVWRCDAVAVCSGLHVTPHLAPLPGIEHVPQSFHSSKFKECKQFGEDTDVLILGAGETAMDLAYLAVTSPTKSVTLSHWDGWQNAPKRLPNPIIKGDVEKWKSLNEKYGQMPPADCSSASLFDTAYVHQWVETSGLPWDYYTAFVKGSSWVLHGTASGPYQYAGGIPKERHHARKSLSNKSNNAMPYIGAPYKPRVQTRREWKRTQRIQIPEIDLQNRQIDLAPWPEYVDKDGIVHFLDNGRPEAEGMKHVQLKPDVIVFATGYTQNFPFLDESYPRPEDADVRRIWKTGRTDVGFIGFVRPGFGAIPPLAELQAQLWVLALLSKLPRPPVFDQDYRLHLGAERRIQYAVDHETYAYRLALDMGSAPSLLQASSHGYQVLRTWAIGPNFNTKFRLVGPWKWDGAAEVMRTEMRKVIDRRRGWFIWTFLTILPIMIFGTLSIACFIVEPFYNVGLWILQPMLLLDSILRSNNTRRSGVKLQ